MRIPALALTAAILLLVPAGAAGAERAAASWTDEALRDQYELGSSLPFADAPWIGTHNSFNSAAEMGGASDHLNQELTLTGQLDAGVRSLELDLHESPRGSGRPVVCHTVPDIGCAAVRDPAPLLAEIGDWLRRPEHSGQVILLYVEEDLDTPAAFDAAAADIEAQLGDLLYEPRGQCEEVPSRLTRDDVRAAGAQVLIVSDCGTGSAWNSTVLSWDRHRESRPDGFEGWPGCGPDYSRRQYDTRLIRYFEDSTRAGLPSADDGLTPETTAAMVRCGVDLFGFDLLEPADPRLDAAVWTWEPGEPGPGRCALIRTGSRSTPGRWIARSCDGLTARPVCRNGDRWLVARRPVGTRWAPRSCRRRGAEFAVPRTGYENQLVRRAMRREHVNSGLLAYRLLGGEWTALDDRG